MLGRGVLGTFFEGLEAPQVLGDVLRAAAGLAFGGGAVCLLVGVQGRLMGHVAAEPKSGVIRMYAWLGSRGLRWGWRSLAVGGALLLASTPFP